MKFGKLLQQTTDGMGAEMASLFVRYKELKKHLKAIKAPQPEAGTAAADTDADAAAAAAHAADAAAAAAEDQQDASTSGNQDAGQGSQLSPEEKKFVDTLNEDLLRLNSFFVEKEEDSVIRLQAISDRLAAASSPSELAALKAALVDFHGEMVLLLHWSLLNYSAVVKILKKHDKRSGLLLRAPYLSNVLQQPFYSTSVMSRLVKSAEEQINALVAKEAAQDPSVAAAASAEAGAAAAGSSGGGASTPATAAAAAAAGKEVAEQPDDDPAGEAAAAAAAGDDDAMLLPACTTVFARTRQALATWQALAKNASTPSTVLPAGSSELVRQLRVRERWARLVGVPPGAAPPPADDGGGEAGGKAADGGAAAAAAAAATPATAEAAAETADKMQPQKQQQDTALHEPPQVEEEAAAKRQRC